MPKLWNETIEAHRDAVREALLEAAAALVEAHGPAGVSMAAIAARAGVGRATLYRYFPDLDALLAAWHERHVGRHLDALAAARDAEHDPGRRLVAVLEAYAAMVHGAARHGGSRLAGMLHRGPHVAAAEGALRALLVDVIAGAAGAGKVRRDVPPAELAEFALGALGAAGNVSRRGVDRLVALTLAGLGPEAAP